MDCAFRYYESEPGRGNMNLCKHSNVRIALYWWNRKYYGGERGKVVRVGGRGRRGQILVRFAHRIAGHLEAWFWRGDLERTVENG
jgi:hypothetical protein